MYLEYNNSIEIEYSKVGNLEHRRNYGQFFTPFKIALFMSEWVLANADENYSILDPAAGFGIFPRALSYLSSKKLQFDLWEIDPNIAQQLKKVISGLNNNSRIFQDDFLKSSWDKKYDGIIANPPYYKHHHINEKEKVFKDICFKTFFNFSIQTNVYCWFLVKAINLLKNNGRLAFIVPSEFFNANYGGKVKEYLKQSGLKLYFISLNFNENVFYNALTTSVIILAEKSNNNEVISFFTVKSPDELDSLNKFLSKHDKITINKHKLDPSTKWRNYFNSYKEVTSEKLIPLTELGRFSRGIATGANKFFTLSIDEVQKHNLPNECLIPCITKASHAKDLYFTQNNFEELKKQGKKVYLFDGQRSNNKSCRDYIKLGEHIGVNKRFLTSKRKPWYSLEKREMSNIWATVFGRSGLKFIWNDSSCINLTCFHAFYPTTKGQEYIDILFIYLYSDIAKNLFEKEKREYGGGLGKFEPNDLNKTLILDFRLLNDNQIDILRKLQKDFLHSSNNAREKILKKANKIFMTLSS